MVIPGAEFVHCKQHGVFIIQRNCRYTTALRLGKIKADEQPLAPSGVNIFRNFFGKGCYE